MHEPLSPELALVDPDLAARARAVLPAPGGGHSASTFRAIGPVAPTVPASAPVREAHHRPYPMWARVTAALWLLVLGILIGGAAIPHAQDVPRVVPPSEDPATICKTPTETPTTPFPDFGGSRLTPGRQ